MKLLYKTGLTFALAASFNMAFAEPERPSHSREGHPPPPEAIEACAGLNAGEAVYFVTRRGHEIEATCQYIEEEQLLVAVPNNPKPKRRD
ncbi:hypothetical protein [Algibacillus agarilyticus]|uniref:hypothetical protein n=1 Tax=Algibacillus agarilyticus TaxID=2234133 RepID=UPI000DD070A6|nr:hypothetical protein [Algibacillus agarilyticus]